MTIDIAQKEQEIVKRIGIIGYGHIGRYLVGKINDDRDLCVEFVHDVDKGKLSGLDPSLLLHSIEEAKERRADLVVEVTSSEWVSKFAPFVLEFADLLIVSVAALAKEGLKEKLDSIAKANKTNYYIPHGAILGLDGIKDAKAIIEEVKITTTRPLVRYGLKEKISKKTVLYEGSVRKACQLFPRTINIHASLALHGLGFDKTHCTVIADPGSRVRSHVIEVKGPGLAWKIDIQSLPVGGKYGPYTTEGIFQTVRRICTHEYGMKLI